MQKFTVPTREEVSENNQQVFDSLQKGLGFVPNLYAYFAKSETALADYLAFQNRKSTLRAKEREVINLIVSQVNGCRYCQSAHTVLGKMNGFALASYLDATVSFGYTAKALQQDTAGTEVGRLCHTKTAENHHINVGEEHQHRRKPKKSSKHFV
jgi:AhpD family alkylhydroperoxidase